MKVAYKLASLHQLTKQNTIKTDGSFCEIEKKKNEHKYIVSKSLFGLETIPNN